MHDAKLLLRFTFLSRNERWCEILKRTTHKFQVSPTRLCLWLSTNLTQNAKSQQRSVAAMAQMYIAIICCAFNGSDQRPFNG